MNWRPISELTDIIASESGLNVGDRIALIVEYTDSHGKPYKQIEMLEATETGWKCDSNPGTLPEFGEAWCFERDLITPPNEPAQEPDLAGLRRDAELSQHENKQLRLIAQAARHLLMAATGPEDGPTSWLETRDRLFDRMKVYSVAALPDPAP